MANAAGKPPAKAADDGAKAQAVAGGNTKPPAAFVPAVESRFATSAEFSFPQVSYIPQAGTPLEHLLQGEYWAGIKQLKTGCRIWVMSEDDTYWAELLVRKTGQGYAKVQVLRKGELDQPTVDLKATDGYEIEFRGQIVKHRVVRKSDGHVLKQGLDSYEDATAWLRDHKRMLAA